MLAATAMVESEGGTLYYEVRGPGPPLPTIPGGVVDAGMYAPAADILAAIHSVLTYGRRAP